MTIRKLSAMPYAQAHIEISDEGVISLFSYVTRVAEIDADGFLTVFGLYSMATRKHIGAFVKEYTPCFDYQSAKACYEGGYKINIETGEVISLVEEE